MCPPGTRKNAPDQGPGRTFTGSTASRTPAALHNLFSHPDYTVGSGITPDRPRHVVRGLASHVTEYSGPFWKYTAGGESHPAPKNLLIIYDAIIAQIKGSCKIFCLEIQRNQKPPYNTEVICPLYRYLLTSLEKQPDP